MRFESEFELVALSAVATFINGDRSTNYPKAEDYVDNGLPFISAADLTDGSIQHNGVKRISMAAYDRLRSGKIQYRDVLFCLRGSIGKLAYVQPHEVGAIASSLVIVRANPRIDSRYLYFILRSQAGQQVAASLNNGSAQPNLSVGELQKVRVPLPAMPIQQQITAILDSFDDRITLLRETNTTLEAIAQALFKSWFVDFDPVHAKQQGRAPEGMDAQTAALFPDAFKESELGMVPKGWRVEKFEAFIKRLPVGKKFDQKSAQAIGAIPILDQGKSGIIGYHNEAPGVTASLDSPVVVFANHTCYMRLINYDFSAIQNVLPFIGNGVDTIWAYMATKGRVKFSEYKGHWPDFCIEKAVVPPTNLTNFYRDKVDCIFRKIRENEISTKLLEELRDTLLPRLISGQLRLPEAQALVEDAVDA